jgi:predicted N-acetyltransferase YhbS
MATRRASRPVRGARTTIRDLRPDDLEAVVELDQHVFGEPRKAYVARRLASLHASDQAMHTIGLVAEDRGTLVGFVMGTLTTGEFGFVEVTALVDSVAVHPAWRRRGIGQQLTNAFVAESAARGAQEVYTLVNWNSWDMLKFFDSMGFGLAQTVPLHKRIGEGERTPS